MKEDKYKTAGTLHLRPDRKPQEVITFDRVDPKSPISKKLRALGLKFSPNGLTYKEDKKEIHVYIPLKHDDLFIVLNLLSFKTEKDLFRAAGAVKLFMMDRSRIPDLNELRNIIKTNGGDPETIKPEGKAKIHRRISSEPKLEMKELEVIEENSFLGSLWNKLISF